MENILLKVALVVEILGLVYVLLYLGGAIMAWTKTKSLFTCGHCHKMNTLLKKNCEHCDEAMKQWVARYKNFFRKRLDCRNDDGIPSWEITKSYIIIDFVMISIALALVVVAMIFTIRAM